jgi:hypothetical protein
VFMVRRHVAGVTSKDELATRRARWSERQEAHAGGSARLVCFASSRARGDASGAAEFLWGGGLSKQYQCRAEHDCWQVFDLLHQYASIDCPPKERLLDPHTCQKRSGEIVCGLCWQHAVSTFDVSIAIRRKPALGLDRRF